jgi:hypothetical protein
VPDARIQLTSEPLNAATAALERTARLYDQIARSNERISKAADREQTRTQQRAARLARGPYSRLEALRGMRGTVAGTEAQDLEYRIGQAERAVSRQRRLGFSGRLATAVSSTRFGAGGASPLIGRTLDVIAPGLAAHLGPIALAAAAVTVAFRALEDIVRTATQSLTAFREASMVTGGTPGEVAGLRAMGLSGADIQARAERLHGAATSGDPFATMRAIQAGVSILPGELGPTDRARQYADAVRYLRVVGQTRGAEEQLRAARSLQMTDALVLANASEQVSREWQLDAKAAEKIFSPEHQKAAADLSAEAQRLADNWESLKTQMAKPLVRPAASAAGWLADAVRAMFDPRAWTMSAEKYRAQVKKEGEDAAKGQVDATDDNTKAIRDLIAATNAHRREITGGGPRAIGIMPGDLSGVELIPALTSGRFKMGAFR